MQDAEAEAIIRTMAENIQTYDQVVEVRWPLDFYSIMDICLNVLVSILFV